ncbi:MAG: hypothetical protein K2X82_28335 [Gemmataceae bacterium]|nr:hypothetical protein [Gemmataceae bacterium]
MGGEPDGYEHEHAAGADDHRTRAVAELGEPDRVFQVGAGWLRAKLLVGVGLVVYGVVANYAWWVHGPQNFHHFVLHLLIWPPALGVGLLVHMFRQRGLVVLVYPAGLLRLRRGEVDSFPWAEVTAVRLKVQKAETAVVVRGPDGEPVSAWLPAEVPAVQMWTAGLTVVRADGVEAHFGPAIGSYDGLAREVQVRTFGRLWADAWGRFRAGEAVAFGDLSAAPAGLRHGGKLLRWAEVKEVSVAGGKLVVKQAGKWLGWATLKDVSDLPNPHVLFALVEEARKRAAPAPVPEPASGGREPGEDDEDL